MIALAEDRKLAVLGGPPTFADPVHVGRPNIPHRDRFLERINAMLDRRWLTNNGPLVREFESRIAALTGVKHCVAMCNATVALEIAIRALELHGEVIIPSYTFVATAHALQWQEVTPVFADIDPMSYNLDPACIERLLTPRTTGIIGVHVWGRACDTAAIEQIARRHRLKVIYDAAHALGCSHNGKMIGEFGSCEVFSFHATKFLNSFEGGAVVTNDEALAHQMQLMRNFGFAGYDRVLYVGTNGKLSEVCAAMGLTSLEALDEIIAVNRRNYECYRNNLEDVPGIKLIDYDTSEHQNYQYIVLEIDPTVASLNRDELVPVLHAENVLARKYFWPCCHRMEPYRSHFPHAHLLLPNTERVAPRVMVLPTGTTLSCEDINKICRIIRSAMLRAGEVCAALGQKPANPLTLVRL
jgi:dTDP-4-amino-4,6-dideoxygalactose transaminase